MLLTRCSKHILKYQTDSKTNWLDKTFSDYKEDLQFYVDLIWEKKLPLNKLLSSKILPINKLKHSKWREIIYKNASEIIRSNIKKKKTSKPIIKDLNINMDFKVFDIEKQENGGEFDEFIRIKLPYLRNHNFAHTIKIPIKYHKIFHKFEDWKRKKCVQLFKENGKYFVNFIFEKEVDTKKDTRSLGIDIGYKKLIVTSDGDVLGEKLNSMYVKMSNKKRGSKNHKQALKHRNNEINRVINSLNLENISQVCIEDLKNILYKTRLSTKVMRKMQYWVYAYAISKLERLCDDNGIKVTKVDPAYTSQTCSKCGDIHKENRKLESFKCVSCGYEIDADYNAAVNILHRGVYRPSNAENLDNKIYDQTNVINNNFLI
jgi:putative transposase